MLHYYVKRYSIYIYDKRGKMNISHMHPKSIIKGFLYKSYGCGNYSYFVDFYFFKISWYKMPFSKEEAEQEFRKMEGRLITEKEQKLRDEQLYVDWKFLRN